MIKCKNLVKSRNYKKYNNGMNHLTWEKVKNYLKKFKVSENSLEVVRKLTVKYRHEGRVQEVLNEVNNYFENNNLQELNCKVIEVDEFGEVREVINPYFKEGLIKALICYFDYLGVYGGGLKNPGSGTLRLLKVGKGRRYAVDGAAYLNATLDAVERLVRVYLGIKYRDISFKEFEGEVFVGFEPWFIEVKDLIKLFPKEVQKTVTFRLIKLVYCRFHNEFLSETEFLNILGYLTKMLDELIEIENVEKEEKSVI